MLMRKYKSKEITLNLPFNIGEFKFVPNDAEQRAAWELYFEFATRVSQRKFDREYSRLRAAFSSLHSLFRTTRDVLRKAGPDVSHGEESLGPLAINILNVGLAPYLTKWHHRLKAHEQNKSDDATDFDYERSWTHFEDAVSELEKLRSDLLIYINALGEISGAIDKKKTKYT